MLILGSDVWLDGAEHAARAAAEELQLPVVANGQGRGILPAGHPLLVTRARSVALGEADLVLVAGTPLDFRLGYGSFGGRNGTPPARVVHLADAPGQIARALRAGRIGSRRPRGDLRRLWPKQAGRGPGLRRLPGPQDWLPRLQAARRAAPRGGRGAAAQRRDADSSAADLRRAGRRCSTPDAVVIGDGGDFVSYAGKYVEPQQPGGWLDPGPYGCLGTGLGYAIAARVARPSARSCCCSATARPDSP